MWLPSHLAKSSACPLASVREAAPAARRDVVAPAPHPLTGAANVEVTTGFLGLARRRPTGIRDGSPGVVSRPRWPP